MPNCAPFDDSAKASPSADIGPALRSGRFFACLPQLFGLAPSTAPELALHPDRIGSYVAAMQTTDRITTHGIGGTGSVPVQYRALRFAEELVLDGNDGDSLRVVHASGRGSRLRIPAGWLSLCLPLSAPLNLESLDGSWELAGKYLQVWREGPLRLDCPSSGSWLVLTGPLTTWRSHVHALGGRHAQGAHEIFPRQSHCPRELRRLLVRLARHARGTSLVGCDPGSLVEATCQVLIEQQRELQERLPRCNGRTLLRRQQTLLRLLRMRHLIEINGDDRPDLARLARSANYSPCHLIRMHREVFDETPSEYAARLRLDRAWSLVRDTRMPVCEITEVLGFESQSSFCRAFKHAYGTTTGQVRHGDRQAKSSHPPPAAALMARRAA